MSKDKKQKRNDSNKSTADQAVKESLPKTEEEYYSKPLDVLFPNGEVSLPDGTSVRVRPLSLTQLPTITKTIGNILSMAAADSNQMLAGLDGDDDGILRKRRAVEFASVAASELSLLVPLVIDRDPDDIPFEVLPDILVLIVSQNITPELIKKWQALIQRAETALTEKFNINLKALSQGDLTQLRKG